MKTVKVIRLISGEEVIAYVKEVEEGFELETPGMIVPTENGVGIMNMMPYTTMQDEPTLLKNSMVGFVTSPVDGLEQQYRSIHQKVIAPEKKIIL